MGPHQRGQLLGVFDGEGLGDVHPEGNGFAEGSFRQMLPTLCGPSPWSNRLSRPQHPTETLLVLVAQEAFLMNLVIFVPQTAQVP